MKKTIDPVKIPGEVSYSDLSTYDKELVEKAVKSRYSRRDVLKLMAVTGVSMATAQNLLKYRWGGHGYDPEKRRQYSICFQPPRS